ncbi:MAG TPA: dTMP kinase [Methylomirabilota bacterium]|jgi:dTMP kinase|nr:dTMP kinase [Methylomirabilota bacterium]
MGEWPPLSLAGRLITVEGVEGAGKSTQVARLAAWLEGLGVRLATTSEPDGSPLGPWVRQLLAERSPLDPVTECFAFALARAEHVRRVIRPALDGGAVVVCDRYADSTVAYQGYGRGVPLDVIAGLNRVATDGLVPDLTIVLDLDVAEGLRRARGRPHDAALSPDPFERLGLEFHERVRKGYRAIHEREPARVELVDAHQPAEALAEAIRVVVAARFGRGGTR